MSNVKDVHIEGYIHFAVESFFLNDCTDKGMIYILGQLNMPSMGIRISYPGETVQIPNCHGGMTTFYRYLITGQEAVQTAMIKRWIDALMRVGVAYKATIQDIEEHSPVTHLNIPTNKDMSVEQKALIMEVAKKMKLLPEQR